ncbi:MAG: hypothetical protein AB7J13_16325, partial [Pyrinomonadaceae bacterium]
MTETIEVKYKPVVDYAGNKAYHKYIIYTDSSGQKWYARGGPAVGDGYGNRGGDTSSQSVSEPNGNIVTEYDKYDEHSPDWDDGATHNSETIASDSDLESAWNAIKAAMDEIASQNHTYRLNGQNSNSAVDTALDRSGLPEPEQDDPGENYAPGSDNILPDSAQSDPTPVISTAAWTLSVVTAIGNARVNGSPLVLDLDDSDTIDLISLTNSETWWDIDQDGFRELSGWVDSADGLLAIDLNENGEIDDNGELFGTVDTDGFTILAQYDSNLDGEITAEDAVWDSLIVWQDTDENGFSESGELHTLADFDIISIDLNATEVSQTNQGHDVTHTSTFTVDDGVNPPDARAVHDVWFEYDTVNTVYDQDYTELEASLFLPDMRGYGTLAHLQIATSLDNSGAGNLLDLVGSFWASDVDDLFTDDSTAMDDITDIMYRWAGVDGLTGDERGPNIDARQLEFLEKLVGQEFRQTGSVGQPDPGPLAAVELEEAFFIAQQNIYARLVGQVLGADLFEGDWYYNIAADNLDGVTGLNQTTIDDLETLAGTMTNKDVFWKNVVRVIEHTVGVDNLSGGDETYLDDAIYDSDNSLSLSGIVDSLAFDAPDGSTYNGTSGSETVTGGVGDDDVNGLDGDDILEGGIGNDDLDGGNDDDALYGESGSDYLKGGWGDDEYHYELGHGHDTIREKGHGAGHEDKIVFGSGIDIDDLTFTRVNNTGLVINIDTGAATGQIVIENHFNYDPASGGQIEEIEFYDTSTYDLDGQSWTTTGTAGNDVMRGVKNGYGGLGNDTLYGGAGNDEIYVNAPG